MIDDRELWACANLLFRQHGAGARDIVRERIAALGEATDEAGVRTFRLIAERLAALERETAPANPH